MNKVQLMQEIERSRKTLSMVEYQQKTLETDKKTTALQRDFIEHLRKKMFTNGPKLTNCSFI